MSNTDLRVTIIRTDGGTQSRVQLDWLAVDEYTHAMLEGATFPPVVVFHDGQDYWCADGFHRLQAAARAGRELVAADVRQGTRRDALLYSVGANSSHGVRRTNADKRAAVLLLLNDGEWAAWSDGAVASKCGVSQAFVSSLRRSLPSQNGFEIVRKATRNGRTYTMDTANIGKPKPQPEPTPVLIPAAAWEAPAELSDLKARLVEDERTVFVCPDCNDIFDNEVWHCMTPGCNHHWPMSRDVCSNCYEPRFAEPVATTPQPVHIHNADAAQGIRAYVTEPVHLVVTSPPYNVGIEYDMHADDMGTHLDMLTDVWRRCYDVMEDGARICVVVPFGVGRTPWVPFAARIMESLQAAGFTLRGQIVWDKNTTGNRTSWGSWRMPSAPALRDTTEAIVVAHKGSGTLAIPDDVLCVDDDGRKYAPWLSADYFMELAQDHWAIAPESAQRVKHPAPYPVELVTRLIHFYAFPGAHVLDPFCGSGTTGVAAVQQGCAATLFDISAQYCQLAQERINGYRNS